MFPLKLAYRPDVDGLRALAVSAVLLFHSFPAVCPGGFIGVDIFFVLSGYLITSLILVDLDRQAFSFASFYAGRIRRIFPSLVLVLTFCLAIGWLLLFPQEWRVMAHNVQASACFYSNILAGRGAGYFETGEQRQPLLHLWSLAIEEQFYLFWPLTLFLLRKWPRWMLPVILLLAAISFVWNVVYATRDPIFTFYYPATRLWELLTGAALAWLLLNHRQIHNRFLNELFGFAGLALLASGFFLLDATKPFPGWWGLLPAAGTTLLIASGPEMWFNRRVLASRSAVFVGLISYPLYLWHWPLLVFLGLLDQSDYHLSPHRVEAARLAALGIAFLLASITYRFWEWPMRFSTVFSSAVRIQILSAAMAGVAIASVYSRHSIEPRLSSPATKELADLSDDRGHCETWMMLPLAAREIPSQGKSATLFVGDSNMAQYEARIQAVIHADPRRASAVFVTSGGCIPLPGLNSSAPGFRCPAFYAYWTAMARQPRFSTIAIAAAWNAYPSLALRTIAGATPNARDLDEAWNGLKITIQSLLKAGKRVVIVASIPVFDGFDPQNAISRLHTPAVWQIPDAPRVLIEARQAGMKARLSLLARDSGAEILWPADYLCQGGRCPGLDSNGSPIYVSYHHLRASMAAKLATFMDDLVRPLEP